MGSDLLFFTAFSFLLAHEMDAVKQKEWQMLPVLSKLKEQSARQVFILLHIPLYGLLLYGLISAGSIRSTVTIALDGFFIIHLGLHILFHKHRMNNFSTLFSQLYIAVPAVLGGLHLLFYS